MALEKIKPLVVDETQDYVFSNVTSHGNITSYNANLGNLATANYVAGTLTTGNQPNISNVGTLGNLTVTSNATVGAIKTDSILHSNGTPWTFGGGSAAGIDTQVQYNSSGEFGASSSFTFNSSTSTLTVTKISANGAGLTNLVGANVVGDVSGANHANVADVANSVAGANVTGQVAFANVANNVAGSNVSGQVANALVAGTVYSSAQPNITSVGTLTSLDVTGNISAGNITTNGSAGNISGANVITANYFVGNGAQLSAITGGNVTGQVAFANVANNVAGANVSGEVTYAATANAVAGANVFGQVSYANVANNVAGANVSGQVANALVAGTVYTNAQPNITSVGTLTSLDVTGNISAGNITTSGSSGNISGANVITANYFVGNGAQLSAITGGNVTGQVANALVAGTVYSSAQPNITSVGTLTSLDVTGNVSAGNVKTDHLLYANGSPYVLHTPAAGSNTQVQFNDASEFAGSANFTFDKTTNTLAVTNIAGTLTTEEQPNITLLGVLSELNVLGDVYVNGNLSVLGTTVTVNSTVTQIIDPIVEQGGDPLGGPLSTNDNMDRGTLLHYYNGTAKDAFMGWDNSNAEFTFGSNVSTTDNIVTINNLGNVRGLNFLGNLIASVGNVAELTATGNVVIANTAGVTAQGSTGTLGQVLTAKGDNTVAWADKFYVGNVPPDTPNYGDVWFYVDDSQDPPIAKLYMWVTDGGSDFFYDFLPPTF